MNWNDNGEDAHLEPQARGNLARMIDDDDRMSAKSVQGVTFIDATGKPLIGLQYANLLYCLPMGDTLVAMFTTHQVTMAGKHLFAQPKDCLMRKLQAHKLEFVESLPGGRERDFGQESSRPITIKVDEVERK